MTTCRKSRPGMPSITITSESRNAASLRPGSRAGFRPQSVSACRFRDFSSVCPQKYPLYAPSCARYATFYLFVPPGMPPGKLINGVNASREAYQEAIRKHIRSLQTITRAYSGILLRTGTLTSFRRSCRRHRRVRERCRRRNSASRLPRRHICRHRDDSP